MKDELLQVLLLDGTVRVTAISAKAMVEEAQRTHGLSRVCTAALGRQLMITAIMAAGLKGEEDSITAIVKGGGPAGNIVTCGRYGALVKGYVPNPAVELPPTTAGKLDVAGAVGLPGRLTVIRDLNLREPYVGECDLVSGEIAEDFARYYLISEQQESIVYLGVHVRSEDGQVLSAGGLVAQPLPDCPDADILTLTDRAQDISQLAALLSEEMSLSDALHIIFVGLPMEVVGEETPALQCDCSRERTERALIAMGKSELESLIEQDGKAELTCHFCNKRYQFSAEDLNGLLREAAR
ncbi:MAG: Hsp33 family molecular chaperone HslO [Eubacteriales bacterium]|nr:Hsp33 family molecular chaperone HslO [Eubacteriales bacterium]